MDLPALQRQVKTLEGSLDALEFWITVSTFLVVVGLVVEYWFPLCELIESIRKRPPFPWKKVLEMAGGVLVTVGVAGELWFQSRSSNQQALIRSDSHQIEGLLNQKAGEAEDRASKAEVRVRELDLELTKLRTPRSLTPSQQRRIEARLRPFHGVQYELAVDPVPEAMSLVGTIDIILRSSNWEYRDSAKTNFRSIFTLQSGSKVEQEYLSGFAVKLTRRMLESDRSAAEALISSLKAEGIDARMELLNDDDPSPNNIHVAVGTKE